MGAERAFALTDDVINVGPIGIAVSNVAQSPASRTGLAWEQYWVIGHQPVIVVLDIHVPAELQLLQVIEADNGLRSGLGASQGGQEQPGQDRDDGDDDQELDQGKCIPLLKCSSQKLCDGSAPMSLVVSL